MSMESYSKALKLGQKKYREQVSTGNYPYLPVLDHLLERTEIDSRTPLGTMDIPLELIVGTSTQGRTTSFSSDFMPLLEPGSEFGQKWSQLEDALLEEGQRDPVSAYEFMGNYYIIEGNKRVSVSKFIGSVSVEGTVTRLVPKRSEDPEVVLNYAYIDFYEKTGINYVRMTKPGRYQRLIAITDDWMHDPWTKEDRSLFRSAWLSFCREYLALGGLQLSCTPGDAISIYIDLFRFPSLLEDSGSTIRHNIEKIWDEYRVTGNDQTVAFLMIPDETTPKKSFLEKLFPSQPQHLRIAFIHNKTAETSAWTYGHELGRTHIEQVFGDLIETCCIDNVEPGHTAYTAIEKAVADGYDVIFTTTPEFIKSSLRAAVEHPDVRILNCSVNTPHSYIRTYYGRMYEAKFLSGVLAGLMVPNNKIGYIADYPIAGMTANINAFALGVQMVNPEANIYLEWSTLKDSRPFQTFRENDISIISDKEMINPGSRHRGFGLYAERDGIKTYLATPIWHWGVFYERIIRSILSGSFDTLDESDAEDPQALNYWWGMSAGVIDHIYSDKIPAHMTQLLNLLKDSIINDRYAPFTGPITDQSGTVRCAKDDVIPPWQVVEMGWLVDNIIGRIPALDELVEEPRRIAVHYRISPETADTKTDAEL